MLGENRELSHGKFSLRNSFGCACHLEQRLGRLAVRECLRAQCYSLFSQVRDELLVSEGLAEESGQHCAHEGNHLRIRGVNLALLHFTQNFLYESESISRVVTPQVFDLTRHEWPKSLQCRSLAKLGVVVLVEDAQIVESLILRRPLLIACLGQFERCTDHFFDFGTVSVKHVLQLRFCLVCDSGLHAHSLVQCPVLC